MLRMQLIVARQAIREIAVGTAFFFKDQTAIENQLIRTAPLKVSVGSVRCFAERIRSIKQLLAFHPIVAHRDTGHRAKALQRIRYAAQLKIPAFRLSLITLVDHQLIR